MTLKELELLIEYRKHFATEHHLSPEVYDDLKQQVRNHKCQPGIHKEHFLFLGVRIVRTWEPKS